jgi:hypothetical protein
MRIISTENDSRIQQAAAAAVAAAAYSTRRVCSETDFNRKIVFKAK